MLDAYILYSLNSATYFGMYEKRVDAVSFAFAEKLLIN